MPSYVIMEWLLRKTPRENDGLESKCAQPAALLSRVNSVAQNYGQIGKQRKKQFLHPVALLTVAISVVTLTDLSITVILAPTSFGG